MIEFVNLTKSYTSKKVLENLNFKISEGSLFGLIGENGAGKTTLINSILGKLDFEGEILIQGISNFEFLEKNRNEILFVPDTPFAYEFLTGFEFVRFVLEMQKVSLESVSKKLELLFELFELADYQNKLIQTYSLGMKRKITLISALLQNPKILILDEPVSGLDAKSIIIFKKLLKSLSQNGSTIIFTTHILDLIENLCDSVAILHNQQIAYSNQNFSLEKSELEIIYLDLIGKNEDENLKKFEELL